MRLDDRMLTGEVISILRAEWCAVERSRGQLLREIKGQAINIFAEHSCRTCHAELTVATSNFTYSL